MASSAEIQRVHRHAARRELLGDPPVIPAMRVEAMDHDDHGARLLGTPPAEEDVQTSGPPKSLFTGAKSLCHGGSPLLSGSCHTIRAMRTRLGLVALLS